MWPPLTSGQKSFAKGVALIEEFQCTVCIPQIIVIPSCQNSVSITYFYRFPAIFVKQVCISQIIVIPSCQNSAPRTVLICYFLLTILSVDHRDAHDNIGYCGAMRQKVKCLTCSIISSWQVYWSTTHMRTPNRNHYYLHAGFILL